MLEEKEAQIMIAYSHKSFNNILNRSQSGCRCVKFVKANTLVQGAHLALQVNLPDGTISLKINCITTGPAFKDF